MQEHVLKKLVDPTRWVSAYADELFRYALRKTGDSSLADDLVQDTFLAALKSMDGFKGVSSEKTWLYAILKHKISDHYRKASTRREKRHEPEHSDHAPSDFFDLHDRWKKDHEPRDWSTDISGPLENKELRKILDYCVEKLPESQRVPFLMRYIDENDSVMICKELDLTTSNYWVIIHRAKLLLRMCLEKNWLAAK